MPTDEHYFIEQTEDGRFAVRAKESARASAVLDTQEEGEIMTANEVAEYLRVDRRQMIRKLGCHQFSQIPRFLVSSNPIFVIGMCEISPIPQLGGLSCKNNYKIARSSRNPPISNAPLAVNWPFPMRFPS